MKKLAQLWITLCLALPGLIAHGDTTLVANINGYSLDADRELIQFTAIQFSDDRVDRLFLDGDSLPENVDTRIDGNGLTLIPGPCTQLWLEPASGRPHRHPFGAECGATGCGFRRREYRA